MLERVDKTYVIHSEVWLCSWFIIYIDILNIDIILSIDISMLGIYYCSSAIFNFAYLH